MPTLVLNNWQGMLGNSIIQVYNSINLVNSVSFIKKGK
jgi:hypothetical protein